MKAKRIKYWLSIGIILLIFLVIAHILAWNFDFSVFNDKIILYDIRLPRTLTALFCGALLSVSGLLLQILFNNPLAGPSILGISSGASLGVALALLLGVGSIQLSVAAFLGALIYSAVLLVISNFIKSTVSLLLVGIMLSAFTGAFIDVLQVFAQAAKLKFFTLWGMGSLQQVNSDELQLFFLALLIVIGISLVVRKEITVFTQGERFSNYLGVNVKRLRWIIIIVSSLAVAVTTAFCGPIAFIGIAVPNMVRIFLKTSNGIYLILGTIIFGAALMLLCDGLILLLDDFFILPINAMTAIFGIPFIIWIIFKDVK